MGGTYVAKFEPDSGNIRWLRYYEMSNYYTSWKGWDFILVGDTNLYICNYDVREGTYDTDMEILCINNEGTPVWGFMHGTDGTSDDPNGICYLNEKLYITGRNGDNLVVLCLSPESSIKEERKSKSDIKFVSLDLSHKYLYDITGRVIKKNILSKKGVYFVKYRNKVLKIVSYKK